ncbi:hypothetical protein [Salmonirosea aquatica]|uniref:DUF1772 domain-containing protein n=1 Tax=Salmonirosea aquatica TaxID=2654236 RepID=A0A7C9FQ74_9BACT|nr:hypothetical protein [Cytophagaceae bacterium SJW1-29]
MNYKTLLYSLTCLSFAIVIGAGTYEHLAVVPQWSAAPPLSLTMFQGEYGLDAGAFWMLIHPVTLVLFIILLVVHWKTDRRRAILIPFSGYLVILLATSLYFVPELMEIVGTPLAEAANPSLTARASLWETLSLVRLVLMSLLALTLFSGLTLPDAKQSS